MDSHERDSAYIPPFVRRLMPNASEAELREATENLRAYLAAIYSIHESRRTDQQVPDSPESNSGVRFPSISD